MDFKLIRQEEELLYCKRLSELDRRLNKPLVVYLSVGQLSDEELSVKSQGAENYLKQLRAQDFVIKVICVVVGIFIFAGIAGLLLFGVKQLFK